MSSVIRATSQLKIKDNAGGVTLVFLKNRELIGVIKEILPFLTDDEKIKLFNELKPF